MRRIWRHAHGNINQELDEMGKKRSFIEFLYKFSFPLWRNSLSQSSPLFQFTCIFLSPFHILWKSAHYSEWTPVFPSHSLHTSFHPDSKGLHTYAKSLYIKDIKYFIPPFIRQSAVQFRKTTMQSRQSASWFREITMKIKVHIYTHLLMGRDV